MTTLISPPIQALLELFDGQLRDVRFADLDAAALNALATQVSEAAQGVAAKQAALDEAQAALQERQGALLQQAQRALAYARVYAESDAELGAKLDAIALPRAPRRPRVEAPPAPADSVRAAPAEPESAEPQGDENEAAIAPAAPRKRKRDTAQPATP